MKETQYIELKASWRDEYLKTIAAFANTDGGKLFIGYDDTGAVVGIDKSKKANNMTWDEVIVPDVSFDAIDRAAVRLFVQRAVGYNRLPADVETEDIHRMFHHLELTNDAGELTRAALLLFGKQPTRFFKSAIFKIGRFGHEDPTNLIINDFVEGNIFQMPDRVMDLLKSKYLLSPVGYRGLQRIETLEIPEKAMREAILNAIIHRDYSSTSSIELRVFDKKITLWNHGAISAPLSIDTLKEVHGSYPRNSLIAKMFYRAGYIEAFGRGIMTIINETVKGGLEEPVFKDFSQGVQLTFLRPQPDKTDETVPLDVRQQKAVDYVREHGSINNATYQEITGCTRKTATRDLKNLVDSGLLIANKSGRYTFYTAFTEGDKDDAV
ncbi:MAG: putative DNA binding domain-containing protein [Prevotellaceae bacterium]|nr:putative DNA binding domain-containing protein [Prevotellaceae bacterium]